MNFYADQRLARALEKFRKDHPDCYKVVENFANDLLAQGISELRVRSYVIWLSKIIEVAGKNPNEFTKDDVRKVLAHYQTLVNQGKYTDSTIFEVKKTLKKFFKWFGKEDLVSWFSVGNVENKLSPSDLITEEEFRRMLDACQNSRDRALISLLYETGARIGEIGSMRIKDVQFDEYGAVVWLPKSKTVSRKLRVVFSTQYLAAWLADHPLKDDPEAPLWIKLTGKNYLQPMEYKDIQWQLKKIAKRAGIKKRIYPHLFRHTRATRLLSQVSEVIGAKYMGWTLGTRMVKRYIHLAAQDVERAILDLYGIKPADESKDLEVKRCPRCTFINDAKARFCSRCGLPLTQDAMIEVEEWEKRKTESAKINVNLDLLKEIIKMQEEIYHLRKQIEELKKNEDSLG